MGNMAVSKQIRVDTLELIEYINSRLRGENLYLADKIGQININDSGRSFCVSFLDANKNTYQKVSISLLCFDLNEERNSFYLGVEKEYDLAILQNRNAQIPKNKPPEPVYEIALVKNDQIFYWDKAGFRDSLPQFKKKSDVYDQIIRLANILMDRPMIDYKKLAPARLDLITYSFAIKKRQNKYTKKVGILFGNPKKYILMHISSFLAGTTPSPMIANEYDHDNQVEDNYPNY
jgi:hypothetical protein